MKFTLKELERVMVTARLIADYHGAEKTDRFKPATYLSFKEVPEINGEVVVFVPPSGKEWIIKVDLFRRGISPLDIFNEEKKGRKK